MSYLGMMFERAPVKLFDWQQPNCSALFLNRKDAGARDELYHVLTHSIDALMGSGINTAIWSNETILVRDKLVLPVLKRLKEEGVVVDVIAYIRRHEAWIKSAYAQWGIKHKTYEGPLRTYKEWVEGCNYLFFPLLRKWADNEGFNFQLRNYDATDDVVKDFFEVAGIGAPEVTGENINVSPDNTLLLLWALYNARFDGQVLPDKFMQFVSPTQLLARNFRAPTPAELFPSPQDIEEITKGSEEDKRKLNAILRKQGQPLLGLKPAGDVQADPQRVQWDVSVATLEMVYALQEQVFQLQEKINELTRS